MAVMTPVVKLLVGCPVWHRAWVMPAWFAALDRALGVAHATAEFVFVGDPGRDPETWGVIEDFAFGRYTTLAVPEERTHGGRDWTTPGRLERMVELRNVLLGEVRRQGPELFLSLDSDVLVHPLALRHLVLACREHPIAGGLTYMTPRDVRASSLGRFGPQGNFVRIQTRAESCPVDIVMACVMMTPAAYAVDYEHHPWGEDVGHAKALRRAGLHPVGCATYVSHHVMDPTMLERPDARSDWPWRSSVPA